MWKSGEDLDPGWLQLLTPKMDSFISVPRTFQMLFWSSLLPHCSNGLILVVLSSCMFSGRTSQKRKKVLLVFPVKNLVT